MVDKQMGYWIKSKKSKTLPTRQLQFEFLGIMELEQCCNVDTALDLLIS